MVSFDSNEDLQRFCAICNRDYRENVSLRGMDIIVNSDNEEESNNYRELSLKLTICVPIYLCSLVDNHYISFRVTNC